VVGSGISARDAAAGHVLLVSGIAGGSSSVEADLVVDGQGQALPSASASGSPTTHLYFLASVPVAAKDVALVVSADGFSQTFSFTKGRREGPQPAVLYASRGRWDQVDSVASSTEIATPDQRQRPGRRGNSPDRFGDHYILPPRHGRHPAQPLQGLACPVRFGPALRRPKRLQRRLQ